MKSRSTSPSRSQPRSSGSSALPIALIIGAVAVVGLCLVGGLAVLIVSFTTLNHVEQDNHRVEHAIADDAQKFPIDEVEKNGPGPWNAPPPNIVEEKKIVLEPPVRVALTDGVYQSKVDFDKNIVAPGDFRCVKRFEFEAKAKTVYWLQAKDNFRIEMRVEGPDAFSQEGQNNNRWQLAFMAPKAGVFTAVVRCAPFDQQWCNLEIREMNGDIALPENLKIRPGVADLPKIETAISLNVYDKQFSSAAFSPDSKFFWIAHGDKTLSLWEHPGFEKKGEYRVTSRFDAMCVDKVGRLYAQTSPADRSGVVSIQKRNVGDISVFENLTPVANGANLPAATRSLKIGGIAARLLNSPDGKWIYYLDTHNRMLGRIDVEKVAIDKTIDGLSTSAANFCLTPDGKRIYCCSTTNRIDVIDTADFKLSHSVSLNKGQPFDIAATNDGIIFFVGQRGDGFSHGNAYAVDLRKKRPDPVSVMPQPIGTHSMFVQLLPDQRAVLFSGDRRVHVCSIPSEPAVMAMTHRETWIRDYFVPGRIIVSPDSRTLLQDSGSILSISR